MGICLNMNYILEGEVVRGILKVSEGERERERDRERERESERAI